MNRMIKKITAFVLIAVLACPIISMAGTATPAYAASLGDVNNSGSADASDALTVLKHVVKIAPISNDLLSSADVNGDNVIDANDALEILKYTVKLVPYFRAQVTSPEVALQLITNHVKNNGEANEDGTRYIYEWYYDEIDGIRYDWIPEVDYSPETNELTFYMAYAYDDPSDGTSYFDSVSMVINGNTAEASYYLLITDEEENLLINEAMLSTATAISSVTSETAFTYKADYPEGLVVDADWQALADEGIHFALEEWDYLLQSRFNMTIQDLGFTAY